MLKMKMHGGYPLCLRLLSFFVYFFAPLSCWPDRRMAIPPYLELDVQKKKRNLFDIDLDMTWHGNDLWVSDLLPRFDSCRYVYFSLFSDWSIFSCPYGTILRHIFSCLALGLSLYNWYDWWETKLVNNVDSLLWLRIDVRAGSRQLISALAGMIPCWRHRIYIYY